MAKRSVPSKAIRYTQRMAAATDVAAEYAAAVELIRAMRQQGVASTRDGVRHWLLPASRVSADFFCSAEHPRFGWFGLLADAVGHGLPAAVYALHLPMLFREAVQQGLSLPAIYARLDRFLLQQQVASHFVCGILVRVAGREIEIINAGMPDALLFAADGRLAEAFPSRQLPFGIDTGRQAVEINVQRYRLARDERAALLVHSDGLSELGILDGNAFGRDGVLATASQGADQVFDRLVRRVGKAASSIHDDVSIVLIPAPLDEQTACLPAQPAVPAIAKLDETDMKSMLDHLERGIVLTDAEQRILYVNPAFTAVTGYQPVEVLGQTPRILNSGRHDVAFYARMWQSLHETGRWSGEIWNRKKDGSLYLEWLDLKALHDETGQIRHYLGAFTELTQKKIQDDRLDYLTLHDPLTGLANRILLTDRGQQAIRRAGRADRSLAVLFIDLDRFKTINDSLGHDIGDEVLVEVSRRLTGVLREDDTLSRFGGDEFVCLLPDIADRHDASLVAQKLLAALDKPVEVAGHRFKIGASIGIAAYPSDGRELDDLIVRADRAMMRAKQAGGNMAKFFSAEMAIAAERQLELEARLDAAIKEDQLVLYYQPKLELATRRIVGAEALVRWRDPHDGLIPPGVFIPVAEKSDLIAKIGGWVMLETCRMLARHDAELSEDFHIAVNVSPLQFERCDLVGEVARVLRETGVPPHRLQLEVTESLLIRDADGVAGMLRRLTELGVTVALDDFGTGYSNLGSLSRLPLEAFKLDQSFVRGIDADSRQESIARSVWHLADGLGKQVIAEGIETCGECIKLLALGYRLGQGYRFGMPMPEEKFMRLLKQWSPAACRCPPEAQPFMAFQ